MSESNSSNDEGQDLDNQIEPQKKSELTDDAFNGQTKENSGLYVYDLQLMAN
jgi:hypothetical protein